MGYCRFVRSVLVGSLATLPFVQPTKCTYVHIFVEYFLATNFTFHSIALLICPVAPCAEVDRTVHTDAVRVKLGLIWV